MVLGVNLKRFLYSELNKINTNLKISFKKIKEELDSYLDTINQNTNEIQSNYEFLLELDKKIEALSERVDELAMMVQPELTIKKYDFNLSLREQEVFLILYAVNKRLSLNAIAKRLGFDVDHVKTYLYNLIMKKVPVNKEYKGDKLFFWLDNNFRVLQARHNIIKIDPSVSKQLLNDKAI